MAIPSPTNLSNVLPPARYCINTDGRHHRFRFPKTAKRYTDDQMKVVYNAGQFLGSVITDHHGLVFSNFAMAEAVNGSVMHHFYIVRYSEMTKEQVHAFVQAMIDLARRNNWGDNILDIELQNLQAYR